MKLLAIIAILAAAHQYHIPARELMIGAIAESDLSPLAERNGKFPDVSYGLFQQTVRFSKDGDGSGSEKNRHINEFLYKNPFYASRIAAQKYIRWRNQYPIVSAWCKYSAPNKNPLKCPHRRNYQNVFDRLYATKRLDRK